MARCLAIAVARGETFLDCATTQGPVIYLALEEKRSEVRDHFRKLGATGEEPIYVHAAAAPQDAVPQLCDLVKKHKPVLVLIDPLFKFVRVRDEKAYAEICAALEPLLSLARDSGAHVLLTHHNGKTDRTDATDAILGSTAIFGGVDSAIILKKYDRHRTIQSSQRYGTDWPETVLEFSSEDKSLSLGEERTEVERNRFADAIVSFLSSCIEPQTREQIEARVEGKTKHKRAAIKQLVEAGKIVESGAGTKGQPFRYVVAQFNSSVSGQSGGSGSCSEKQEGCDDPCSPYRVGTRAQESQEVANAAVNSDEKLVPEVPGAPTESRESREQALPKPDHGSACDLAQQVLVPAEPLESRTAKALQIDFLEGAL